MVHSFPKATTGVSLSLILSRLNNSSMFGSFSISIQEKNTLFLAEKVTNAKGIGRKA